MTPRARAIRFAVFGCGVVTPFSVSLIVAWRVRRRSASSRCDIRFFNRIIFMYLMMYIYTPRRKSCQQEKV